MEIRCAEDGNNLLAHIAAVDVKGRLGPGGVDGIMIVFEKSLGWRLRGGGPKFQPSVQNAPRKMVGVLVS